MEIWLVMRDPLARYEISNYGRIRKRVNKTHPERNRMFLFPKQYPEKGIIRTTINSGKHFSVSRLVFEAFNGDLVDGLVIAHLNGDYTDNRPSNLVQVSQMENIHHKKIHGTWQQGDKHPKALPQHSYQLAEKVRFLLQSAKRRESGRLVRGERNRIAAECEVSLDFLSTIQYGGWVKHV